MSFLKGIWKHTSIKHHHKLAEEQALSYNSNSEDMESEAPGAHNIWSFSVKYLGSTPLEQARSDKATAQAIKSIFALAKAAGKKLPEVKLNVNIKGIKVTEIGTNELLYDISIFRISYCSADGTHRRVFAFIATNNNNMLECHAFICPKRKVALNIALTVARVFNVVYDLMESNDISRSSESSNQITDKEITRKNEEHPVNNLILNYNQKYQEVNESSNLLIDLSTDNLI